MPLSVRVPLLLVTILSAMVLALVTHEVGHLVAGRLMRLRMFLFTAGPIRIERGPDGRRHVGWVRSVREVGGMAGMAYGTSRDGGGPRRALLVFALGGPIASVILGAVAMAAYFGLGLAATTWARDGAVKALAGGVMLYAVTSLALGVLTSVPNRFGGQASDGERVRLLLRGGPVADRHAALFATSGAYGAGVGPRDWDERFLAAILAPGDDGTFDAGFGRYLAYLHALDREDAAAAAAHARAMAAASAPPALRHLLRAEAAYFAAAYEGDVASARARLAEAGASPLRDAYTRRRAELAILVAAGDAAAGGTAFRDLAATADADPNAGFLRDELRRLAAATRHMGAPSVRAHG
jgi:hypothetical protein